MPIYEYECGSCGEEHETIQSMSAGPLRKCPACGRLKLRRKISRSAFHLKGEGWYVTDYGKNGKKPEKEDAGGESKSESSDKSKSESTSAAASESKTESKTESKSGGEKKSGEPKKAKSKAAD